ncbi:putative octanoyltransferase [Parachaetomium inaequale]|uniref:Octanoyltransferase n=1 Tax=Parachaetomium inaequale TaxID=2588326 RepID=A0AAN6P894_9PEZI|nr:putative octanoyltransferase [Parachaetomium inaequale]
MAPLRLRHLHLPSIHPHYIPYRLASRVQEHLRRQHLDFKDGSAPDQPPPPTLLSFTPSPIYTLGRRQTAPLTQAEAVRLTAPLQIPGHGTADSQNGSSTGGVLIPPELIHSPRGGLTTYHGPGQVVLWPVLDLKSPSHKSFSVKCYARLLEETTIATLRSLFGIDAFTTDDPGVWVRVRRPIPSFTSPAQGRKPGEPGEEGEAGGDRDGGERAKIAALGVHLRRHVTALGTAINVAMPGPEVTDERVNPWARIVACGLAGRGVTSVAGETSVKGEVASASAASGGAGRERLVAGAWAGELARRIGLGAGGVEVVETGEVVRLMEALLLAAGGGGDETREERGYVERMREGI